MFDEGIFKKLFARLPILDAKCVCLRGGLIYKLAVYLFVAA